MAYYTVEVRPDISPVFWQPQYSGDIPKWHFAVPAVSPEAAVRLMERHYPGRPVRVVPRL
jgi:hypothetical protein